MALAGEQEPLPVNGFGPAEVSLPTGATGLAPVVIATHGNYDTPEWTCRVWRQITGAKSFVLCPRGIPRKDSPSPSNLVYEYRSNRELEREINAGLAALKERWPEHLRAESLETGPMTYAGFSQGAIMGVEIVLRNPGKFPTVVLIEGGFDQWGRGPAQKFVAGGGQRLLLACGQWNCEHAGSRLVTQLKGAGAQARMIVARGAGHTYGGPVAELIEDAFPWLAEVESAPRTQSVLDETGRPGAGAK